MKTDLALSLSRTFIARAIAALGGLMLIIVLSRIFGPSGIGIFAILQSIYFGSALLARFGMDNALMRYVGQNHKSTSVVWYLKWSLITAVVLSVLISLLVFILRHTLSDLFKSEALIELIPGIAVTIPAFTVSFIFSGFMKGVRKPASATLLENGTVPLIASLLVLLINSLLVIELQAIGWIMAVASWTVVSIGTWQVFKWFSQNKLEEDKDKPNYKMFIDTSSAFFVMSLAQFMQVVISVFIAGMFLNSYDLGVFKAAERLAMLISFILMVINAVFPPRFATYYRDGDLIGLTVLARKSGLIGVVLALPMLLLCWIKPQFVLGLLGPEFIEGESLLRIIATAQFINVATGSVGFLLNMTGHEKLMRNIALICNIMGLFCMCILIPTFGSLGAAIALALTLILQNLVALYYVWIKLGICMIPSYTNRK
ncbi:oligosaccharide flippase family protein [Cobetia sp. 1CM21F]|uniref:lipopolysaccharide biosynthesis protein n=1 Tax=Cobetia sp. 1CM21F TaxID=2929163 RepID=UPI0020BF9551|nr:oligosaccharide flippase family protein [Cobetia sp. 1CM21F]MCK8066920.1 oligosaccharide flippase family protein [Cobetia sp. 1CM21F]